MAKIIQLACDVADVHRRYAEIHVALFGVSSFRTALNAVMGRGFWRYSEYGNTLSELRVRLADLEQQVEECGGTGRTSHGAEELRRAMLEYIGVLDRVVRVLSEINARLGDKEPGYREVDDAGKSPFTRDKIEYERAVNDMEYLGSRMNRLFSRY